MKDIKVEDRKTGAGAPEAGARPGVAPSFNGSGRRQQGHGAAISAGGAPADGQHPKGKGKKRRKRKRGRKVFARDGVRPDAVPAPQETGSAKPTEAPIAVPTPSPAPQ